MILSLGHRLNAVITRFSLGNKGLTALGATGATGFASEMSRLGRSPLYSPGKPPILS